MSNGITPRNKIILDDDNNIINWDNQIVFVLYQYNVKKDLKYEVFF